MRDMLLTSALSGSLALYPLGLHAQTYDTWTLTREVLNAAANYTGVLTTAHTQVRKYITWDWNTSYATPSQLARTKALLAEITAGQKIDTERFPNIVSILNWDVLNSYDVRFRYCDNMLLSYFNGTGFKHGLSAQQIIDAPVLRAQRAGRTFNRDQLGRVVDGPAADDPAVDDPTVGGVMMLNTGSRNQTIPACMGTQFGGALADGTVAYMTSAVRKLGPREDLSPRTENRDVSCPAPFSDSPDTLRQAREVERNWRFPDSPYLQDLPAVLRDAVAEIEGLWEDSDDRCYKLVITPNPKIERGCPPGYSGERLKESAMMEPGRDYRSAAKRPLPPTYGEPRTVSNTCRYVPPPPPPPKRVDCWAIGSEKAQNACLRNQRESGNRGGGNRGGNGQNRNDGSFDVDGDGIGDFESVGEAQSAGYSDGTQVNQGCAGGCNGPSGGPTGGGSGAGNDGGRDKIVCTAMNARYGFGSYRQAIWLAHARRMSPYHQTGYHLIALPLVRYGYRAEGRTHLAIRHALEHIARHRTADLRAEMQQRKRRILGRGYRAVLEPLCYAVGWLAGGRQVAGIADVAQIAALPKSGSAAPKHFKNNKETVQ